MTDEVQAAIAPASLHPVNLRGVCEHGGYVVPRWGHTDLIALLS
jgi:hypothetical protein